MLVILNMHLNNASFGFDSEEKHVSRFAYLKIDTYTTHYAHTSNLSVFNMTT